MISYCFNMAKIDDCCFVLWYIVHCCDVFFCKHFRLFLHLMYILLYSDEHSARVSALCPCISDDEKLGNSSMNLEPLRALHSHYLDILATVVTKIHTTQSTKKLSDIFSLTPLIKKLSTLLRLQVTQYGVEQVPDEGE